MSDLTGLTIQQARVIMQALAQHARRIADELTPDAALALRDHAHRAHAAITVLFGPATPSEMAWLKAASQKILEIDSDVFEQYLPDQYAALVASLGEEPSATQVDQLDLPAAKSKSLLPR